MSEGWYFFQVLTGRERKARDRLVAAGYRISVPVYEMIERRRGKNITTELVLFDGYLLGRVDLGDRRSNASHGILRDPDVVGFVRGAGMIWHLPDADIERIWELENERGRLPEPVAERIKIGVSGRVLDGPFTSFPGMVTRSDFEIDVSREDVDGRIVVDRLPGVVVEVSIFGRGTPVEMPEHWFEAV